MARRRVIDLDHDLPLRAAPLEAGALAQVFGGCKTSGICHPGVPQECCPEIGCNMQSNHTYRCSSSAWM